MVRPPNIDPNICNPYYGRPQKGTPSFGKPRITRFRVQGLRLGFPYIDVMTFVLCSNLIGDADLVHGKKKNITNVPFMNIKLLSHYS